MHGGTRTATWGAHCPKSEDAVPTKSMLPLLPGDLIAERAHAESDRLIIEARTKVRDTLWSHGRT